MWIGDWECGRRSVVETVAEGASVNDEVDAGLEGEEVVGGEAEGWVLQGASVQGDFVRIGECVGNLW